MAKLNPYLNFQGTCREAMEFYKSCLGGELKFTTVGESPAAALMPAEMSQKILHSTLITGSMVIMGSDMSADKSYQKGNNIYLTLICESKEEVEMLFSKLSAGGQVLQPLKEEFFGIFGSLNDKYGFNWMFQFGPEQK